MHARIVLGWIALVAVAAFLLLFLGLPLLTSLVAGLDPGLLLEAVRHPVYRAGMLNSAAIAALTTVLTMLIAVPLAWLGARCTFRGKGVLEALLLAPLILPPFVGAIGVYQLFGHYGVVNALLGGLGISAAAAPDWLGDHRFLLVCVVEALGLYPILYLTLVAAFARVDGALLEAAAGLGASRLTRLRRIVLPLVRPGLFAGGILVFVWSFTELGTPLMLGYDRAMPVQIYNGLAEAERNRLPFALVVIMLTLSVTLYLVARLVFVRRSAAFIGKGSAAAAALRLCGWRAVGAAVPFIAVLILALAPHVVVVLTAFAGDWYASVLPRTWTMSHAREALAHPLVVPGIVNSLGYAAAATALALVIGVFIAWTSARWRPRGWQILDAAAMVPLAVPGIILAFGYLAMATGIPWLKAWLDPTRNPTLLLIIAYAVRRLPQVVRSAAAGLEQAPVAYEEAAASLGAGFAYRLRRITLPLVAGSIAAGALLTFSFSMLEVSDSLVLAQRKEFSPITRVIFELVQILGSGPAVACAFAAWAMLFLAAALGAAAALRGRSPMGLLRD